MSLRDSAIVAYAETKVMEKSDRDVWVLAGEILEALLDQTGVEKNEIDGLVMAGLTGTGAGNPFWALGPGTAVALLGTSFALLNYAFDEIGNPALRPARRKRGTRG